MSLLIKNSEIVTPNERYVADALILSVLPNLPGFLVTIKMRSPASVAPSFISLYYYTCFVGFFLAFILYLLGRRIPPND